MAGSERDASRAAIAAILGFALLLLPGLPAGAESGEAVDFPTAVDAALRDNALVSAAGFEAQAAREDARSARGLYSYNFV